MPGSVEMGTKNPAQPGTPPIANRAEQPILEFRSVSKAFATGQGTVQALADITLAVRPGEFLTVVGPSGCGKSTLLNLLVGLERPKNSVDRMRIGYVMQSDNLYPWRTLAQNVELPLELRGAPPARRREIVRHFLEKVRLGDFADRYPHELSGGMRQRGNIVRALCFSPSVIIMDEPFGPLDAQTRLLLQMQLLELGAEDRKIPRVALAPLFVVWFGIGLLPKIVLVFTLVFFVIFYNTYAGIRSVDRRYTDLAWVMGANEPELFRKVILPAASPYIILGLKLSIPYALIGAIIGEFVASSAGLGWKIQMETSLYNTTGTMAGLVVLMLIVVAMNAGRLTAADVDITQKVLKLNGVLSKSFALADVFDPSFLPTAG